MSNPLRNRMRSPGLRPAFSAGLPREGMATDQAESNYWQQIIWAPTEIKLCSFDALWNDVKSLSQDTAAWVFVTSCPRMDASFWLLSAGCGKSVNLKGFMLDKNRALPPVPLWISLWRVCCCVFSFLSISSPAVLAHWQLLPPNFLISAMSQKWQNFHDFGIHVICFRNMSNDWLPSLVSCPKYIFLYF